MIRRLIRGSLTARFPGFGQEARNWRAFAAAFRSPRTPFSGLNATLRGLSLGRGIPFPRCGSIWPAQPDHGAGACLTAAGICGCVLVSADSFSGLNAFLRRFVSYLQLLVDQSQIEQWQSRMLSCVCIVNEIVASSHRSAFRAQKRDVSVTCALGSAIPNRIQRRLIYLSLSWADAVSHDCIAHAQRFLHSLSRISRSLVLHLGVELGSDQDDDDRKPDPDHEADSGT